jgi:cobalt-zinc-cadmium efflux system outer membrane protein
MNAPRVACFFFAAASAFAFEDAAPPASLAALVEEAGKNNPDIVAALRGWQAAAQVPTQVSTLPDPQVTVQQFSVGSPRPFAGFTNSDFAYIGFGVSQDVPYPGKLKLRGEAAERDAAVARERVDSVKRSVVEQAKAAYFQLAYVQQTLGILQRDGTLLEQIEKVAEARYRTGQGTQQDVLKAQLQQTKLLRELAHHHELMGTAQAQIKKLLNRPQESADIAVAELTDTPLRYSSDELLAKVRTGDPDIAGRQEMVRKQSLQVEMARKDRYPDFNVQYMWEHTAEQYRDYYELTFSARLPIYRRRKLDPELTQAVKELDRSQREYESQVQQAYFEVKDELIAAETAEQLLKIYREGLIPQALATFRAGLASYESGQEDFQTLLSAFLDVLDFDEEYWKSLADHETALARIEQLTGMAIQ